MTGRLATALALLLSAVAAAHPPHGGGHDDHPVALGQPAYPLVAESAIEPPPLPAHLPRYVMDWAIDTGAARIDAVQTVVWTNPTTRPTDRLVFHVYPQMTPDVNELEAYERTLESFRLDPRTGIDRQGKRLSFRRITAGGRELTFGFDPDVETQLIVALPQPVGPGEAVEVTLDYTASIPPYQGRFGQWEGVTNLLNWYPTVAYYDEHGWDAPPYVAWHQPWLQEAGIYDVHLHVPVTQQVACSGQVTAEETTADGIRHLTVAAHGVRDFACTLSDRYEVHEAEIDGVRLRVCAFPEHRRMAEFMLNTAVECLPLYNRWFGRYPHATFTVAEAFFGWNGNETGGMVLIDARVFETPWAGRRYVDNLLAHEICHQWWYGTVGTDGFRETWLDEGLVTHLTDVRWYLKYRDTPLIDWPKGLRWLPNVDPEMFNHYGYFLFRRKGGRGVVLSPLPEIGHVHNLFNLAYDRGSRVMGMIHHRLGDDRFFALLRTCYRRYGYRVMKTEDFRREVEALTGEDWRPFFDDWLRTEKIADWQVADVTIADAAPGYKTSVTVRQGGQIAEPTVVEWTADGVAAAGGRIPLRPADGAYAVGDATVTPLGPDRWRLDFYSAQRPTQVVVDPEGIVLDDDLVNNRWRRWPDMVVTPLLLPPHETPYVYGLDRNTVAVGPGIDKSGRLTVRAAMQRMFEYRVVPYVNYNLRDGSLAGGVDTQLFYFPDHNLSVGGFWEYLFTTDIPDTPADPAPDDQGRLYLRWTGTQTSSFFYDDNHYAEIYTRTGSNCYPYANLRDIPDGVEGYRDVNAVGARFHLNTMMPYWNPQRGMNVDAYAEHGFHVGGRGESFNRAFGQLSAVRKLPDATGPLSDTRLAGRLAGGVGSPDNGQHFRFGGPLFFRGQNRDDTYGSAMWLASLEWRVPVWRGIDRPVADNFARLNDLYGSVFYDVGEAYLNGESLGVDHAVGVGLYFQTALISFVEQATFRLEIAHSLRTDDTFLQFGLYHAF